MSLPFEDRHYFAGPSGYVTPNETVEIWRDLVKGLRVDRAAAICSAGEVGLFALLPTVRRELVLIDHSYKSLHNAAVKYLMLQELGGAELYRMIVEADYKALREAVKRAKAQLPERLQRTYLDTQPFVSRDRKHPPGSGGFYYSDYVPQLQHTWKRLDPKWIIAACKKLDRVKFIHGDVSDLIADGPFDMLYISNALGHTGRNHRAPSAKEWTKAVRPGGYILAASTYGTLKLQANCTTLKATRSKSDMAWNQELHQVPA